MNTPIKLSRLENIFKVTDQEPLFYKTTLEEISRLCEALRIAHGALEFYKSMLVGGSAADEAIAKISELVEL